MLERHHGVLGVRESLNIFKYLRALNRLCRGERVVTQVGPPVVGADEHQLDAGVHPGAELRVGHQVAKVRRVQHPLLAEGVAQLRDGLLVQSLPRRAVREDHGEVRPPVAPVLVGALLHGHGLPPAHQLIERLQGVVRRQAVGEAEHHARIGPVVHLGGEEQRVAPQAALHRELERLLLVAVEKVVSELGSHLLHVA